MNEYDRENLQFLLNASKEVLKDWWDNVEEDDHEYASELLDTYSEELKITSCLLDDNISDIVEAGELLKKFRL